MTEPALGARDDGKLRAAALRDVRRARGLSTEAVAAGMNLRRRTYERFEAGQGRLNLDYVHRFAEVTASDPYALLFSILIGSPSFAARAADNKMMTIFVILLQAFDRRLGDRIADLDTRSVLAAFGEMFDELADVGLARSDEAAAFLREGRRDLSTTRPKPGR